MDPPITELKGFVASGSSFKAKPGETDDLIPVLLVIRMTNRAKRLGSHDPTIHLLLLKIQKNMKRLMFIPPFTNY